jgi:4-diphosphocytidyl-2-C-methyl-D-erythritol kinase
MAHGEFLGRIAADLSALNVPAPAKINLFLAVTGRRPDGFHDLVSVAAPLAWGDTISVGAQDGSFSVACDVGGIPTDGTNLVIRAAAAFADATGWRGGAHFSISKRIPAGAGLGGASSDAASALAALNGLAGAPLDDASLARVASGVGSDCALFLHKGPVVMRGRGERVEPLGPAASRRIRARRVLVFKPGFGIPTPWAYGRLAEFPQGCVPASEAEARLASWTASPSAPAGDLLFNSMERPAFAKFAALPLLLGLIRARWGIAAGMTGSGSACFALPADDADTGPIAGAIREAWGPSAFVVDTRFA